MKGRRPTAEQWKKFYELLESSGNVSLSARGAGIGRTTVYEAMRTDPAVAERVDDAKECAIEHLETEARRRAMSSSDVLLIFLLKALRPERYRDSYRAPEHAVLQDFIIDLSPV
jgi:hypothetical protein